MIHPKWYNQRVAKLKYKIQVSEILKSTIFTVYHAYPPEKSK